MEPIIKQKTCAHCEQVFQITEEDIQIYQKMRVTEPSLCEYCRLQRKMAFRNDQNYYKNACFLCKKSVISMYSPDKPFPILCKECFWGNSWDPLNYGINYNPEISFLEQFAQMRQKIPRISIFNTQSENSDFTIHSSRNKDCYRSSSLVDCESIYFSDWLVKSKDCMDCLMCTNCELCYECIDCSNCYACNYLEKCNNMSDSIYCFDCRSSKFLVGCVGMRNHKNYILNQPASKEECFRVIHELKINSQNRREFLNKFEELKRKTPKPACWVTNSENCTGNSIIDSKNAKMAFNCREIEDGKYIYDGVKAKDAYNILRTANGECIYECMGALELKFGKFCSLTYHSDNMVYSDNCQNCSYCFGCMSLNGNSYCILNKQYSEAEYKELVPKIINQMKTSQEYGDFFPIEMSSFGYNETKAQDYLPHTKEYVTGRGWTWCDYEPEIPKEMNMINANELPENIADVDNSIIQKAIICEITGKPFKIIPQELEFYRRKGLPLPRRNINERRLERLIKQGGYGLYSRTCEKCGIEMQTPYPPDSTDTIYCNNCYLHTVY